MPAVRAFVASAELSTVALTLFDLAVLRLLAMWTNSLHGILPDGKHYRGLAASRTLKWIYLVLALIMIVCLPIAMYVNALVAFGYLAAAILYNICNGYAWGVIIWLFISVYRMPGEAIAIKRKQGLVLLLFMFFDGGFIYGWKIYAGITWMVRLSILLWSGLLSGFEVPPVGGPWQAAPGGTLVPVNPPPYSSEKV